MTRKQDILIQVGLKLLAAKADSTALVQHLAKLRKQKTAEVQAVLTDLANRDADGIAEYVRANCTPTPTPAQAAAKRLREIALLLTLTYKPGCVEKEQTTMARALHDLLWGGVENMPAVLRNQIETIYESSRCANRRLVKLALELVAAQVE